MKPYDKNLYSLGLTAPVVWQDQATYLEERMLMAADVAAAQERVLILAVRAQHLAEQSLEDGEVALEESNNVAEAFALFTSYENDLATATNELNKYRRRHGH